MKERPILFTPENAQKVHDGTKTQTRRILKVQPLPPVTRWIMKDYWWIPKGVSDAVQQQFISTWPSAIKCPYGQVGDRLWIREAVCEYDLKEYGIGVLYKGACPSVEVYKSLKPIFKPSIHMPRRLCRTVVELTEIRVERVQEMSEDDAKAEGSYLGRCACLPKSKDRTPIEMMFRQTWCRVHGQEFKDLWASINGQDSWGLNPFVWVLTFRRIEA